MYFVGLIIFFLGTSPVTSPLPLSISTDQVAALLELASRGTLRAAAEALVITEQGLRNRLTALEERLGLSLYRKSRGIRRGDPLTQEGRRILPLAQSFLAKAEELREIASAPAVREVHVAASHYLIAYVLIDAVRAFHASQETVRIRLSARSELEIEAALREDPNMALGVAAPYEPAGDLDYLHLFSMHWSLIAPPRHQILKKRRLSLTEIARHPLIAYERGSTGRQHILEAFHRQGLTPRIEMEATTTDIIVRMVEAGLGIGIVPLLASGAVTRGHRVEVRSLGKQIRPIDSGILSRRGQKLPATAESFVRFVREAVEADHGG